MTHEPIRKALAALHYRAYSFGFEVGKSGKTIESVDWSSKAEKAIEEVEAEVSKLLADLDRVTRERDEALKDARRYRMVRRGQHWSVINDIGDTLRGEELDAAIDAALGDVGV